MTRLSTFGQAVLDPQSPVPKGLTGPDGAPAGKRFDVYRNNVAVSLTEALETGFPVIRKLVGEDFFKAMAGVHLRQSPPQTPLLMSYGAAFPAFLESFPPVAHLPYLADVARLELALREAYHAADSTPMDPTCLQDLPTDVLMTTRFSMAPAMRLLSSPYPIHGIWRANTEATAPPPQPQAEAVLITRPGFDPIVDPLTPGAAVFCSILHSGAHFGAALDRACKTDPDFDLSATLGLLLTRGAIHSLTES
ncbi:DNA-binding domain-containing protein [Fluviibacterium sp. DFM31]|uniref:DNA-binding domain-containing protein n=1 Tax=Meridianimarinicoccus marinus TaxID=3231483 RepID=A0ABV3L4U6_9RHOB